MDVPAAKDGQVCGRLDSAAWLLLLTWAAGLSAVPARSTSA